MEQNQQSVSPQQPRKRATLQMLMWLRYVLPTAWWRSARDGFWKSFWEKERQTESLRLGTEAPDLKDSERAILTEAICDEYPFKRILEVGVGAGQNFVLLGPLLPSAEITGIDRDAAMVGATKNFFQAAGITNLNFKESSVEKLDYESGYFDVVYSCACLLYLPPDKLVQALREMIRVSSRKIFLLEQHLEQSQQSKLVEDSELGKQYWLHNYRVALEKTGMPLTVQLKKIPNPTWTIEQWGKFGYFFEVSIET